MSTAAPRSGSAGTVARPGQMNLPLYRVGACSLEGRLQSLCSTRPIGLSERLGGLHLHLAVLDARLETVDGDRGRAARHGARVDLELRAVPGAGDQLAVERALGE